MGESAVINLRKVRSERDRGGEAALFLPHLKLFV